MKNNIFYYLDRVGYTLLCFCINLVLILPSVFLVGLLFLVRKVIDVYLLHCCKGRFKLLSPMDATCSVDFAKGHSRYSFCGLVKTSLNEAKLEKLQTKIGSHVNSQTYEKLRYGLTTKFGFPCWEETGNFDIREHVKLIQGAEMEKSISENEMMSLLTSKMNSLATNGGRPDWEILIVPNVRMKGDISSPYMALFFFLNHGYMDANCVIQFLQTALFDSDGLGPVSMAVMNTLAQNQEKSSSNFPERFSLEFKTFLYGPTNFLRVILSNRKSIFQESISKDMTTFMGRSKLGFSSSSMNKIRMAFNCQTKSVTIYAFLAALQRVAERKDLPIPDGLNVAFTHAILPYPPNQGAQNRFSALIKRLPLMNESGATNHQRQLGEIDKLIQINEENEQLIKIMWWAGQSLGFIPKIMIRFVRKYACFAPLGVTLVPGSKRLFKLENGELEEVFSIPPMVDGIQYLIAFGNYGGRLSASFRVGKTPVIQSQHDFNILITEFDNCLKDLEREANAKIIIAQKEMNK